MSRRSIPIPEVLEGLAQAATRAAMGIGELRDYPYAGQIYFSDAPSRCRGTDRSYTIAPPEHHHVGREMTCHSLGCSRPRFALEGPLDGATN